MWVYGEARRALLCLSGGWGHGTVWGLTDVGETVTTLTRKGWVQDWSYGEAAV
jgi:hypothetical protein